ncbi:chromosome segregation protein SMC [Shewanella atlantica]|uniref:Chromosome partition protein Smc n=1 Tax=Shewanella atlantica TaxID=271099 RepID=A0A3S0KN54_9GAMM|nr:chromosome segregation protein SMC [Shewanella atlantica]RTR34151.1 chromosome segregation protein SMC [Shewanella atlantica]
MRLKQIKLAGFKSFVDSTKIPFLNPLSAIIGPNGCGKSNVIDAVRWVLGESSAKHLRGDSMADVIFNGSSARRPVSVAGVELFFENQNGRLTGQYASYQEISVKRQVTRDGDSSYFLNGQKCRRKDITDLFMGTGLGPRSYAIIEQGTISRLIESKPQELRVFIEEAAGISRYKERRRETENRIRHTRENLERLGDIRTELGRQLEKLAEQASAAKQYRELKQSERTLDSELSVSRYIELTNQTEKLTLEVNKLELNKAELDAEKEKCELTLTQLSVQLVELECEEQKRVEDFYQCGNQIGKLEQDLKHRQQQDAHIDQRISAIVTKLDNHNAQLRSDETLKGALSLEFENQTPLVDSLASSSNDLTARLNELEGEGERLSTSLNLHKEQVSGYRLEHEVSRSKLNHLEVMVEQKKQQIEDNRKQSAEVEAEQFGQDHQVQASKLEELVTEADLQQEINEESELRLTSATQEQAKLRAKQEALNQSLAEEKGRLALVAKLLPDETELEGEKALWQLLEVKPGWEKAVELLFDGLLKTPAGVEAGREGFSPWEQQTWSVVSCSANLSPWLSNVLWAESIDAAKPMLSALGDNERIATADGYLLGKGFVIRKGTDSGSLVQLKREQDALELSITDSEALLSDLLSHSHELHATIEPLKLSLQSGNEHLQQLRLTIAGLSSQISAAKHRAQECEARSQRLKLECQQYKRDLDELFSTQTTLSKKVEAGLAQLQAAETEQNHSVLQLQLKAEQIKALKEQGASQQSKLNESNSVMQALKTKIALNAQSISQQQARIEELTSAKQALENQLAKQDADNEDGQLSALNEQLAKALAKQELQQTELSTLRQEQTRLQEASDSAGLTKKQQLGKIEHLTQSISTLKLRREGLKGQADSQLMQLNEQEIKLDEVKLSLDMNKSSQARQRELERIRARITHLGAINLAAIEEYEQQSERKSYLDSQDADLTSALTSLEEAIRKIDRETKSRFKETFDKVNQDLGVLFPKVFGGGSAHLALTHDDLLETGVTIMARPPGKKNSTIHLLSGGEKALTALSLVFAIFRLNPAPFCMLDEVDAPLDDANVDRFCRLVKEMSQSVQFIYISHNKITMELADQLIGVTMHEPGVSRIVAVDIDEAVALADAV